MVANSPVPDRACHTRGLTEENPYSTRAKPQSGPSQGIKKQQRKLIASHFQQHTEAATPMHTNIKRAIETLSTPPHVGNTGTSSPAS